jgi:DNA polymerase III delta subunit
MDRNVHDDARMVLYVGEGEHVAHAVHEHVRYRWAGAAAQVENVDGSDLAAVHSALDGGLFGGAPYVCIHNFEKLPSAMLAERIAHVGREVRVVAGAANTKRKGFSPKDFSAVAEIVELDKSWLRGEMGRIFRRRQISVDTGAMRLIMERCGTDLYKVRGIADICRMAGVESLGETRCTQLLGSFRSDTKMYEVVDSVIEGRLHHALAAAGEIDPVPLADMLADATGHMRCAADRSSAEHAKQCKLHPFVAEKRGREQRRFGDDAVARALDAACDLALQARTKESPSSQEIVARIHMALHRSS